MGRARNTFHSSGIGEEEGSGTLVSQCGGPGHAPLANGPIGFGGRDQGLGLRAFITTWNAELYN